MLKSIVRTYSSIVKWFRFKFKWRNFLVFSRISVVISDWPEAATFCLTYKSSMSTYPCHFCLVKRDNLANINLSEQQMELRTHNNIIQYLDQNLEKSVCIENISNFFGFYLKFYIIF